MKPGEQKIVKIEAPFTDEISSLTIIRLLDRHSVMVLKVKFTCNIAMLDMMNNSNSETLILNPREALRILDLRSLGYYKIKQGVILIQPHSWNVLYCHANIWNVVINYLPYNHLIWV